MTTHCETCGQALPSEAPVQEGALFTIEEAIGQPKPTPLIPDDSWLERNAEFQLGKEAGYRGDQLIMDEHSAEYLAGYEEGQLAKQQYLARFGKPDS